MEGRSGPARQVRSRLLRLEVLVRVTPLILSILCLTAAPLVAQYRGSVGAPETFSAYAHVEGAPGAAAALIQVVIQRYTPAVERTGLENALESGGYPAFVPALRKASEAGYIEHGTSRFTIRYARETQRGTGRRIEVVTDKPVYFLGGGAPEPKPRAGFEVAVLRMDVDGIGFGSGVMAAAARLKAVPEGGVQIEDYAEEPIRLLSVRRLP
jgi:hypothetical protein